MKRLNLRTIWWRPGQDLNPFGLVRFFSLPGFIVITIVTGILVVLLTLRAQQMTMKKNEDYLLLLAANLNHQIFQQFVLPTAFEKGGRITLSDPEQSHRLDEVVRTTIHGFHVDQLNQYDQEGVFSYSTANLPLGKKSDDLPGVKKALAGENYFEVPGYGPLSVLWPRSTQSKNLKAFIPFRLEKELTTHSGPVIGVFEITQDISGDLAEINKFRLLILVILVVIMGLLFIILRQIVKQAGRILARRQEEQRSLEAQLHQSERLAALGEMTVGVAHEIRNPLGIVSSTAELLQERLARYEPQNRLAWIIVEEANRLNEKVTEFLDFARPRVPHLRPCDLEAVLDRAWSSGAGDPAPGDRGHPGIPSPGPGTGRGPGPVVPGLPEPAAQRHPGHARGRPAHRVHPTGPPGARRRDPLCGHRRRHRAGEPEKGPQPFLHHQGKR